MFCCSSGIMGLLNKLHIKVLVWKLKFSILKHVNVIRFSVSGKMQFSDSWYVTQGILLIISFPADRGMI